MLGNLLEGIVELDPVTGEHNLAVPTGDRVVTHSIQELLAKYVGQEVRLTLISFEELEQLTALARQVGATEG